MGCSVVSTWEVRAVEGLIADGVTRPAVCSCALRGSPGCQRLRLIVKPHATPGLAGAQLGRELFGTLLARELGVPVAEPALVLVAAPHAHDMSIRVTAARGKGVTVSPGLAFGTVYQDGLRSLLGYPDKLTEAGLADAVSLYCLDTILGQRDRLEANPNCALWHGRVLAYDFEATLGDDTLAVTRWRRPLSELLDPQPVFTRALRKRGPVPSVEPFVQALSALGPELLDQIVGCIPDEWSFEGLSAARHVNAVRERAEEFIDEMGRRVLIWQSRSR